MDIPLLITSPSSTSERRISPHWTLAELHTRLHPITGIPPGDQLLTLQGADTSTPLTSPTPTTTPLSAFPLHPHQTLSVTDARPPHLRPNYTDPAGVPKFALPLEEYAQRTDSVRAFKQRHQLGRFAPPTSTVPPPAPTIPLAARVRLLPPSDSRLGTVRFVGAIPALSPAAPDAPDDSAPAPALPVWVGVELDEPVGAHDGAVRGTRVFTCGPKRGVFVRAERVVVGDWKVEGLGEEGEEEF